MPAFRFTALDNSVLSERVRRHIGARRFAFNRCLAAVKDGLDEKRRRPEAEVPWSGYSLINWWNGWKRSKDAGCVFAVDSSGDAELVEQGLSWRNEVCAQIFEEAAVDLGRPHGAFSASKKGSRCGERVGFPHFQKKGKGPESFRLRNRVSRTGRDSIRVGAQGIRSVSLPVIGTVAVREDTRRLRRLLRPGPDGTPRARICSATVSLRRGRTILTLTCELSDLHPGIRHQPESGEESEGVDDAEGLAAVDPLSGVISLGFLRYRGPGVHRASIDDAGRRLCVTALFDRTAAARRAVICSQVPFLDHSRCWRCTEFQFGYVSGSARH